MASCKQESTPGRKGQTISAAAHHTGLRMLCCLLLFAVKTVAQSGSESPIQFTGTSTLTGFYSNHSPIGQEIDPHYLNWHFRGRLNLGIIPFHVTAMLSSQQHNKLQRMNNFSIQLDNHSLLRQPSLRDKLGIFKYVETFEIGRARPNYSQLLLHGISLDGVNIALRFNALHLAFAYGTSQRPVQSAGISNQQFKQEMLFGRLGLGKRNGSYLNISLLSARDDENSIDPAPTFYVRRPDTLIHHLDTFFIPLDSLPVQRKPTASLMPGVEAGLLLFNKSLLIHAEIAGSIRTGNTKSEFAPILNVPENLEGIYQSRLSSSASYAYLLRTELNLAGTRFEGSMRKIAPGFIAPGVAFTRQDHLAYQLRLTQQLFNRKISIQPHFRWFRNNLSNQQKQTIYTLIWGVTMAWRPSKLPFVQLSYSPHSQEVHQLSNVQLNKARIITGSTGMNYQLNNLRAFSGLNWSRQLMEYRMDQVRNNYQGDNFSFQQSLQLSKPISLQANLGYSFFEANDDTSLTSQFGFRTTYRRTKKWNIAIGLRHINQNNERKRTGITARAAYDFGKYGEIRLTAEPVVYRDVLMPEREYDEYAFRLSLINKW